MQTDKSKDVPLYIQITNQLKEMIVKEELPSGVKMPSERAMAKLIGVHRNTVKRAYGELRADGYIKSRERSGFFVCFPQNISGTSSHIQYGLRWGDIIKNAYINNRIEEQFSSYLSSDAKYSFSGDVMQQDDIGKEDIAAILKELSSDRDSKLYGLTSRQGDYELRKQVVFLLLQNGINVNPSEVQIVTESFQAIEYIANMIIGEDDAVIIPKLVCPEIVRVFSSVGANIISVGMDEEGMICEQVEREIHSHNVKLIYVEPDFANPTGTVMSLERRKKLLELSYEYNIPIIEEGGNSDLRHEGEKILPIKALDMHDSVIFVYTFYYKLPAGIRIAFVTGNRRMIGDLGAVVQSRIMCQDTLSQMILKELLREGLYEKNVSIINKRDCRNKLLMIEKLKDSIERGLEVQKPEGGVFLWCKLPDVIDERLFRQKLFEQGVSYMPGDIFFASRDADGNYIRLNYSCCRDQDISEGIELFNEAFKQCL